MNRIIFEKGVSPLATVYENVVIGKNVTIFPGAVVGRPPYSSGAARMIDYKNLPSLVIGDNTVIGANAVIYSGTTIGNNCMICDCACVRESVTIGDNSLVAMGVTVNRDAKIGNNVKIMDLSHITSNIVIEDDVFIAPMVSTANDNSMNRSDAKMEDMKGPYIKKGSRIGQSACILPGITIGKNAVVGANSVVTRHVEDNTTVMGVPAKKKS